MRRIVAFGCEGSTLVGTIDEALGTTGVLIVSGGNEARSGAHRGMALLAQRLAGEGVPAFRFDRRGVGDSEGGNHGYASSAPDIAAALAAFRREQPHLTRIIGFGNCDAATALLLVPHDCDALVLANPWLGDEQAPPPPAALRRHYLRRLADWRSWRSYLSGDVARRVKGLADILATARKQPLGERVAFALPARPTMIVLAAGDRTAQVFAASLPLPSTIRTVSIDTASHSFAGQGEALASILLEAVVSLDDKHAR